MDKNSVSSYSWQNWAELTVQSKTVQSEEGKIQSNWYMTSDSQKADTLLIAKIE